MTLHEANRVVMPEVISRLDVLYSFERPLTLIFSGCERYDWCQSSLGFSRLGRDDLLTGAGPRLLISLRHDSSPLLFRQVRGNVDRKVAPSYHLGGDTTPRGAPHPGRKWRDPHLSQARFPDRKSVV